MTRKVRVYDPEGYAPSVTGSRLAPRHEEGLSGKLVYLVDCLFDNSEQFLLQLQQWFAEHLPTVRTQIIKPRESWEDDPAMRARIEADGNAAILGVGL